MIRAGLVDEVRRLRAAGLERNPSAARAIGYREVLALFDGRIAERDLVNEIVKNTKGLVRKQRTWFRTQVPPHRAVSVVDAGADFPVISIPG
jgi:tRNA dimethylallyltransferase